MYELDYALANDVVAKSVTLKADSRRATALLTVKKAKRGRKWTQLVAKPEAARGLIEKDWSRGRTRRTRTRRRRRPRRRRRRHGARARGSLPPARDPAEAEVRRRDAAMAECNGRVSETSLAQLRGDASARPARRTGAAGAGVGLLRNREYSEATPLLERAIASGGVAVRRARAVGHRAARRRRPRL